MNDGLGNHSSEYPKLKFRRLSDCQEEEACHYILGDMRGKNGG